MTARTRRAAFVVLAPLAALAGACTDRYAITHVHLTPGGDATVELSGDHPALEIRNTGEQPADLAVAGRGTTRVDSPSLPLPPRGAWRAELPGGGEVAIRNRGRVDARLQLWTPGWAGLRVVVHPNPPVPGETGRVVIDEPR